MCNIYCTYCHSYYNKILDNVVSRYCYVHGHNRCWRGRRWVGSDEPGGPLRGQSLLGSVLESKVGVNHLNRRLHQLRREGCTSPNWVVFLSTGVLKRIGDRLLVSFFSESGCVALQIRELVGCPALESGWCLGCGGSLRGSVLRGGACEPVAFSKSGLNRSDRCSINQLGSCRSSSLW